jgi:hypothetical protein
MAFKPLVPGSQVRLEVLVRESAKVRLVIMSLNFGNLLKKLDSVREAGYVDTLSLNDAYKAFTLRFPRAPDLRRESLYRLVRGHTRSSRGTARSDGTKERNDYNC